MKRFRLNYRDMNKEMKKPLTGNRSGHSTLAHTDHPRETELGHSSAQSYEGSLPHPPPCEQCDEKWQLAFAATLESIAMVDNENTRLRAELERSQAREKELLDAVKLYQRADAHDNAEKERRIAALISDQSVVAVQYARQVRSLEKTVNSLRAELAKAKSVHRGEMEHKQDHCREHIQMLEECEAREKELAEQNQNLRKALEAYEVLDGPEWNDLRKSTLSEKGE